MNGVLNLRVSKRTYTRSFYKLGFIRCLSTEDKRLFKEETIMRHAYIRGILALIWLAAAAVSGVSGNLEWAGLYVLMGAAFGYSAWASWKKAKSDKRRN